jgi:phosphoribosyl-AMP cyclohydrolase
VVILQQTSIGARIFRKLLQEGNSISDTSDIAAAREQGGEFMPRFDSAGLITAIAQDSASGEVLMVAFMDPEALDATRRTGLAHFHSRSRGRLWKKGETSGHVLHVEAILVDCDQDALVLKVRPAGPACHTGERSCFYRALEGEGLTRLDG